VPAGDFFEAAVAVHDDPRTVAAWMVTEVRGVLDGRRVDELPFSGAELGALAALVEKRVVSRRAAKDVLAHMAVHGGMGDVSGGAAQDALAHSASPGGARGSALEWWGLRAATADGALCSVMDTVLASWPDKVAEYRSGNHNLIGLFLGEVMKATRGAADPKAARTLLTERLDT